MFPFDGGRVEGMVRGFKISCCGLEFSPASNHIAVGDLAGTVWVCAVKEDVPVASANVSYEGYIGQFCHAYVCVCLCTVSLESITHYTTYYCNPTGAIVY